MSKIRPNPFFPANIAALVRELGVLWRELATTVNDADVKLNASVPATAAATGTPGMIAYDASYIYICTATNTWKRVAIATW